MEHPEEELIRPIIRALLEPDRRRETLREFEAALRRYTGEPPPEWWWIFSGLQVDAALYEPDPSKFCTGMVDEQRMQLILNRAVADLKVAGILVDA